MQIGQSTGVDVRVEVRVDTAGPPGGAEAVSEVRVGPLGWHEAAVSVAKRSMRRMRDRQETCSAPSIRSPPTRSRQRCLASAA